MDREGVEVWLKEYDIKDYTINEDLSVDVAGDVDLSAKCLSKIPVKFRNISGTFDCEDNELTNLEGFPINISGNLYCGSNQLTDLMGCPEVIGGGFYCDNNRLVSLIGCPTSVVGFDCSDNRLVSLNGCPEVVGGDFYCSYNNLSDSEDFLYEYSSDQVVQYYKNKNLNEGLLVVLPEVIGIGIKSKKI